MPDESGHGDAERRRALLEETGRTYAAYVQSGYSERWSGREPGVAIAVADRDAWVVRALEPALAGTVVDLGCGDGALGMLLDTAARRPRRLIGFDLLEARVALARAHLPWAEFHQGSVDELGLPDGSANAVVAMTLFSSLTDDWFVRRVVAEIGRVMAPGGRLVVYDIRYPSPRNPHVRPVRPKMLALLFPGWSMQVRAMTLLPPLARSRLAGGSRRYRTLEAIPVLRSHIGAVLTKP